MGPTMGYSNGGSHGCLNMRDDKGIAWLFSQVRLGDKVVVHR
ncbi:L,D-transpeptidase [Aestuariimicrobium sp. p3-SID1156]|nr:L,D-transpeptidase [Aestuariimicrobium sp. p3-SID1156]MCT1458352.1 L,D-transpeptidase [Aestuariimicrobium sp. p3-SID1156]